MREPRHDWPCRKCAPGVPCGVARAEDAYLDEQDRIEESRQIHREQTAALGRLGVQRWWPHRVPGMSDHVWLEELGKAQRRHQPHSYASRDRDIESGRRRMR